MSLATGKPALKTALLAIVNNTDDEQSSDVAIDNFLDGLQTWIEGAQATIPAGVVSTGVSPSVIANPIPIILSIA